jgi:superfamily I DNA and/or RNA helicase
MLHKLCSPQQIPSETCKMHDDETRRILDLLKDVPELKHKSAPYMWIDHDSPCMRNNTTHSLYNPIEAKKSADVALAIGTLINDRNIRIITPYRGQVKILIFIT